MEKVRQVVFRIISGAMREETVAFSILDWYMLESRLNRPECTLFYEDTRTETMDSREYSEESERRRYWKECVAYVAVAGMDKTDVPRVVLSYAVGEGVLRLSFPGAKKTAKRENEIVTNLQRANTALRMMS